MNAINEARTMPNALDPDLMTAAERIDELAGILAVGLRRLRARMSSSFFAESGESSLDFPPHRSGHGPRSQQAEKTRS